MLGLTAICWAIWKARNRLCFEKKTVKDLVILFFCLCIYVLLGRSISRVGTCDDQCWSGDDDADGAADLEKTACGAVED
jgi:hypothetical protein